MHRVPCIIAVLGTAMGLPVIEVEPQIGMALSNSSCKAKWEECHPTGSCCGGFLCVKKTAEYHQCRPECPTGKGFACETTAPSNTPTKVPTLENTQIVVIGKGNGKRSKTITLPKGVVCPMTEVSKSNWIGGFTWGDTFSLAQTGTSLVVTRTDKAEGWGMDLKIVCDQTAEFEPTRFPTRSPTGWELAAPDYTDSPHCGGAKGFLGKCGQCETNEQCASVYYNQSGFCCPYMKKCVYSSYTSCYLPIAASGEGKRDYESKRWVNCNLAKTCWTKDGNPCPVTHVPTATPSQTPTDRPVADVVSLPSADLKTDAPSETPTRTPTDVPSAMPVAPKTPRVRSSTVPARKFTLVTKMSKAEFDAQKAQAQLKLAAALKISLDRLRLEWKTAIAATGSGVIELQVASAGEIELLILERLLDNETAEASIETAASTLKDMPLTDIASAAGISVESLAEAPSAVFVARPTDLKADHKSDHNGASGGLAQTATVLAASVLATLLWSGTLC